MTTRWMLILIGFCLMALTQALLNLLPLWRLHKRIVQILEVGFFCGFVVAMVGVIPRPWEVAP